MVVADLTLGARGIKRLDPALQPIIRLNENLYSFMPNLLMNSSVERNFTVLLNRIPEEKDVYARLLDEKELVMKESIKRQIALPTLRYFEGKIGNAPPVDLVIISDTDKACLFLELKWFIEPGRSARDP